MNKITPRKVYILIVMAKIAKKLTELVGNTSLLELTSFGKHYSLEARLIGKLEYFNPC